jgi:histidinol-phosphate aminotransferase
MNFCPVIRPAIQAFTPYGPGMSIESVRRRYGLDRVIKLASNENPLGASPLAQKALRERADSVFRYPVSGNSDLIRALARHHGISPERIVAGNGSDEVIDLLLRVLVDPGKREVAGFRPCFGIYETQTALSGLTFRQAPLNADFSFPWDALLALVNENTALVLVTTPDNPSGFCPPAAELAALARALPPACLLVLDEAYMDFCAEEAAHSLLPMLPEFPNVAVIRTFSKSRGMAGLRLGYGILPPEVARYVQRAALPFSVNVLAGAAGMAALEDDAFYRETLRVVREGREQLSAGLLCLGCRVYPSQANFVMFGPPCGLDASAVFEALLERGVIIRPLAGYRLPDLLRVSVGLPEENDMFLQAMRDLVCSGKS